MSPRPAPAAYEPALTLYLRRYDETERAWLLGRSAFLAVWVPKSSVRLEALPGPSLGNPLVRVQLPAALARWQQLIRQDLGEPSQGGGS